jgi:hypothetical protein
MELPLYDEQIGRVEPSKDFDYYWGEFLQKNKKASWNFI